MQLFQDSWDGGENVDGGENDEFNHTKKKNLDLKELYKTQQSLVVSSLCVPRLLYHEALSSPQMSYSRLVMEFIENAIHLDDLFALLLTG